MPEFYLAPSSVYRLYYNRIALESNTWNHCLCLRYSVFSFKFYSKIADKVGALSLFFFTIIQNKREKSIAAMVMLCVRA